MAAGLGIAAGAFAQNYAQAMGLRSRLDSEKQQQEANEIELQRKRDALAAQKELAQLHTNFQDPNYDFVGGKPYDPVPEGGITPPGASRPTDPYADTARVKAYYNRIAPLLERQAYATGNTAAFLGIRKEIDNLRKDRFVERVGSALARIESGDEGGINELQSVYDMFPDGRKITGGKINQDGTVLLQYEQNGQPGERVISKEQLANFGRLALNPADAAKLRFQMLMDDKNKAYQTSERLGKQEYETGERIAGQGFRSTERKETQAYQTDERIAGQEYRTSERKAAEAYELPFKQGALGVSQQNAGSARISANASARNAETNAEIKRDTLETNKVIRKSAADAKVEGDAQKFFNNAFGTSDFKVKTDEEVKALLPKQKQAYEAARAKNAERMARRNAATGLWDLNDRNLSPSFISSALPLIEQRIRDGKGADGTDPGTGLPYVNINGKKVLLPKD